MCLTGRNLIINCTSTDVNQFFGATDSVETDVETEGTRLRLRGCLSIT